MASPILPIVYRNSGARTTGPVASKLRRKTIELSALKNWVLTANEDWKLLRHSLGDGNIAVKQLDFLLSKIILIFVAILPIIFIFNLSLELLAFLWVVSPLFLVFGDTIKHVFEGINFLMVRQPFSVGEACVIDGRKMVVDKISLLTTDFITSDNQKYSFPNAVLSSKDICNLNRCQEIWETVEFSVKPKNPDSLQALQGLIRDYIVGKNDH